MNKLVLSLFLCMSTAMSAQIFTSVSLRKIAGETASDTRIAGISQAGDYVLTTTLGNKGLKKLDMSTGREEVLTTAAGAGVGAVVSDDGSEVVFREVHFTTDEHVRMTALKSVKVDSKAVSEVMSPSRQLKAYGFSGNTAFTMDENDDIMTQKGVSRSLIDKTAPSVFLEDLQLMLNKDGETVLLSPNGTEETYIWPSISPDKKHILYYVGGEGAYVCDMEGKNVKFIAHDCRAPQWYDNNTIIGMDDKDDGERLLTSCIMAYTLDGKSQRLTDPVSLTMYPYCSKTKGVVACSTGYGEIYLINLTK